MRISTVFQFVLLASPLLGVAGLSSDESMTDFFDSDIKSQAWTEIAQGSVTANRDSLDSDPCFAKMRAGVGRGPLCWAHEFDNEEIIETLLNAVVDPNAKDKSGLTPGQIPKAPSLTFSAGEEHFDDHDHYEFEYEDPYATRGGVDHSEMRRFQV